MNASAVLQALQRASHFLPVSRASIEQGLAGFHLAGRFQYFREKCTVLLDVAHNPQSVRVLARHLREHHAGQKIHAVFAIMRDKDITAVMEPVRERMADWYLAPLAMERAAPVALLAEVLHTLTSVPVYSGFRYRAGSSPSRRCGFNFRFFFSGSRIFGFEVMNVR